MDIATVLEEYLADVSTLPSDIAFILDEIKVKDTKLVEAQKRIHQWDGPIQKFVKQQGALQEFPKEQAYYPKIRSDFQECILLQQEKTKLATMGLFLVCKHVNRLDEQVAKLEAEGQLAPVSLTVDESPSASVEPEPLNSRTHRAGSVDRRASKPDVRRESSVSASSLGNSASVVQSREGTPDLGPSSAKNGASSLQVRSTNLSSRNGGESENADANNARLSLKRGHSSSRNRPPIMEEGGELFCFCKKGSIGNMIGCDGDSCQIEWFHWDCVGLTEDPKGSWYCPQCRENIKKQAR